MYTQGWLTDALAGGVGDDELLLGAGARHEADFEPAAVHVLAEEAGVAVDLDHPALQHGDVHAVHQHDVGRTAWVGSSSSAKFE